MSRGGLKAEEKGWLGYCKVSQLLFTFVFNKTYTILAYFLCASIYY